MDSAYPSIAHPDFTAQRPIDGLMCPLLADSTMACCPHCALQEGKVQNEKHGLCKCALLSHISKWASTRLRLSAGLGQPLVSFQGEFVVTSPQILMFMHAQVCDVFWYLYITYAILPYALLSSRNLHHPV